MSTPRRAVIVGAGIAGLTSAIALERAGWRVALLERGDHLRGDTTAVSLQPNAVRALRSLGLGLPLDAISTPVAGGTLCREDGRVLASQPGPDPDRPGARTVVARREDLFEALVAGLGDNVEIHTGVTTTHVDLVQAAAGDTTRRWPADLVVGADGLASAVRTGIDRAAKTRTTGTVAFRALIPAHRAPDLPEGATEIHGATGQRFMFSPLGKRGACWTAIVRGGPRPESAEIRHQLLSTWFGSWCDPVSKLLEVTRPKEILQTELRYLHPLPKKYIHTSEASGAVIVGDAAHAMPPELGQGAGMALEDAVTLGLCLTDKTVGAGLRYYEELRHARTVRMAKTAQRMSSMLGSRGKISGAMRNGLVRAVSEHWMSRGNGADWTPPDLGR